MANLPQFISATGMPRPLPEGVPSGPGSVCAIRAATSKERFYSDSCILTPDSLLVSK